MKKILPFIIVAVSLTYCSTFDVYFKDDMIKNKPQSILIGFFEKRDVSYEPFTAKNFRDALNYEFFKLGYASTLLKMPSLEPEQNIKDRKLFYDLKEKNIAAHCLENSCDIFIQGTLMEQVSDDLVSKDYCSTIVVKIYLSNGKQLGEAHYITSDPLSDSKELHKVSRKIAEKIHGELN